MEVIKYDRRTSDEPFTVERRIAERVSVLEIRVDNVDAIVSDNRELLEKFLVKFDKHITDETESSKSMNNTMIKVSSVVDNLTTEIKRTNDTLTTFNEKLDTTQTKVTEWDTAVKTIIKAVAVVTMLISAGWTVFQYVETHQIQVEKK